MFNKKKKYFKHKLQGVQKMIWDLEFKREKTLMIREEVRSEYDAVRSKLFIIENQIKTFPEKKENWSDEQKGIEDKQILLNRDRERYEAQMKQLDIDVQGSKSTNEYPDGISGINDQLDSLRELKIMVEQYIKKI